MTDDEANVDALRTELDQIKDAMGIRERNAAALEYWLYFAVVVVVASALSQVVHLQRYPAWVHTLVWGGTVGGFFLAVGLGAFSERPRFSGGPGKPDVALLFVVIWLASVPIQVVFGGTNAYEGYVNASARVLGLAVVLVGVGYVLSGNLMKAYHIRRRDRGAFYVGGLWMVALGAAIPHVDLLRNWGYAVFGGCYAVYAAAVYVYLRGDGDA